MNCDKSDDIFLEEWKAAREATSQFDGILVDLRKYGFSILTGLTTAQGLIGFTQEFTNIMIGVIVVTMNLVVILYWLDRYYDGLLWGSVMRTRFLEIFRMETKLSLYISGFIRTAHIGWILHAIYYGFLIGLLFLGLLVAKKSNEPSLTTMLYVSFFALIGASLLVVYFSDHQRREMVKNVEEKFKLCKKKIDESPIDKANLIKQLEEEVMEELLPELYKKEGSKV